MNNDERQAVVTVAGMARMCGLSRQRFHQLVKEGVFPSPLYDRDTRRPFFNEELQAVCVEVRRRNQGVNGKIVLFYAPRRNVISSTRKATKRQQPKVNTGVIDGLRSLGLVVTPKQVEAAMKEVFPQGTSGVEHGELLRAVFLHVKKRQEQER